MKPGCEFKEFCEAYNDKKYNNKIISIDYNKCDKITTEEMNDLCPIYSIYSNFLDSINQTVDKLTINANKTLKNITKTLVKTNNLYTKYFK